MYYITINDLNKAIRQNFHKIPHDIDLVIAVPRSGTIAASIICEYLNCPLSDIDSFCAGLPPSGGGRLRYFKEHNNEKKKALIVDDTVYNGTSKKKVKEKLEQFKDKDKYEFIYLVAYLEGNKGANDVDIYLEDIRWMGSNVNEPVLYEWNIFHHNEFTMLRTIFDIDGVFNVDPPDERNEKEYIEFIKNAPPLFVPTCPIGTILTYRLSKNKEITINWLKEHNIRYNNLIMFNAQTWEERNNSGITPELLKGNYYKNDTNSILFIESNDFQARRIHNISKKPVYCVDTNTFYN